MHKNPPEASDRAVGIIRPEQTIIGLYIQMHESGHDESNLLSLQNAYRVASQMFSGVYRANEKPFICHGVGTASAVAHFDKRLDLILAGLLHAAFDLGEFPDGRFGGHSNKHKRWLADRVGDGPAALAARYDKFKFSPAHVADLTKSYTPDTDRDIVKVRLCNEIDDLANGGLAFATKHGEVVGPHAANCAVLADRIGEPEIGRTIVAMAEASDAMQWAEFLRRNPRGYRTAPSLRSYLRLRNMRRRGKPVKVL